MAAKAGASYISPFIGRLDDIEGAMIGADVATVPPVVLFKLLKHPLTDRGLEPFLADWREARLELPRTEEASV